MVVIGRLAHRVSEEAAYGRVAGFTVGRTFLSGSSSWPGRCREFSLGKS